MKALWNKFKAELDEWLDELGRYVLTFGVLLGVPYLIIKLIKFAWTH